MSNFLKFAGIILGIWVVIGIIFLVSQQSTKQGSQNDSPVVAIVNGVELTREEYNGRLAQSESKDSEQIVSQMVSEELVLQEAQKQNFVASDEAIQARYDQLKTNFESDEEFQQALVAEGLTEDQLKKNISEQIIIQQYIDKITQENPIEISDEEINAYYESSIEGTEEPPKLEEVYDQIRDQIKNTKQSEVIQGVVSNLSDQADIQILL